MKPRRCGPLSLTCRSPPSQADLARRGAGCALGQPNIEFFGLDDVMPNNLNERVPREHAKIPNVRNWAVRDYGNRIGIWRLMEVLTRHGGLNSEVCDHHPEIIEEAGRLGLELISHNRTNAMRLTEMDASQEREAVRATIDQAPGRLARRRPGRDLEHARLPRGSEASATSATGSTTISRIYSKSAARRWCRCPIRFRPTTCPRISR